MYRFIFRVSVRVTVRVVFVALSLFFPSLTQAATGNVLFLSANESVSVSEDASVYGSVGSEAVNVVGSPQLKLDGNIERVELPNSLGSYAFQVDGTRISAFLGSTPAIVFSGLNQPVTLVFADGAALLTLHGLGKAMLGEGRLSTSPAPLSIELDTTRLSSTRNSTFFISPQGSDQNNGSYTQPWATIQFGVDKVESGDHLIVQGGTYTETVLIEGAADSGTLENPITILAQDGTVIDGTGLVPTSRQGLITINGASHLVIDGFELRNFKTADGIRINDMPVGILLVGSLTNVTVQNTVIHGIENRSTCEQTDDDCYPGANGIGVYGTTVDGITNIVFRNNEVHSNILASSEAFTINGNVSGIQLYDNYVHDNNNIGFDFIGYEGECALCSEENDRARNAYVKNNRAINNSTRVVVNGFNYNPYYGSDGDSAVGFYVDGGHHIVFDGNAASENDLGIEIASEHAGKSSQDILMINNMIYLNRQLGISIGGYAEDPDGPGGGDAKNIALYNNSFYQNRGFGTEIVFAYRAKQVELANNIIVGSGTLGENFESLAGDQSAVIWRNNLWWASRGDDADSIPEVQPMIGDPQYVDPVRGHLSVTCRSPALDAGQQLPDVSGWRDPFWLSVFATDAGLVPSHGFTDFYQRARFDGAIDLGAAESDCP